MTGTWGPRGAAVAVIAAAIALEAVVAAQVRPGPPSGTARGLSNTGAIRGRVVDAQTEVGVVRAEVQAVAAAINVIRRTRTDASGAYALDGLAPGRYALRVSKAPYLTTDLGEGEVVADETAGVVVVKADRTSEAPDIRLARGAVIAGRVVDEAGDPLVRAAVDVMTMVEIEPGEVPRTYPLGIRARETDDQGRYRLFGLPPGTYVVRVIPAPVASSRDRKGPDHGPTFHPDARGVGDARSVTVGVGEEVHGVDITVAPKRGTDADRRGPSGTAR